MFNRAFYLRLMLLSLAIAGVAGAVLMFVAKMDSEITSRLVGSAILTAVASALMLPASGMAENKKSFYAGSVAMVLIVAEFLLIMCAIWDMNIGSDFGEHMGEMAACLGIVAIPVVIILRFVGRPETWLLVPAGLILFSVAMVLFAIAIWYPSPQWRSDDWPIWRTAWAIYLLSPLVVAALTGLNFQHRSTLWRLIGIFAAGAAFVLTFTGALDNNNYAQSAYLQKLESDFALSVSVAIVIALASLSLLVSLKPQQIWLRWGTLLAAAIAGAAATCSIRYPQGRYSPNELFERISTGCGILAGCGSIAMAVLARLNRFHRDNRQRREKLELSELTLVCPVCNRKSTLPLGSSACPGCGLRFSMAAEEPRCATCGYSLLMSQSGQCPECGGKDLAPAVG
ncbi:MAG TPA: hypothetical protein VGG19_20080 [Tepidisphaeraceae bacterium]|jgi:hypothetical protein